MTRQRVALRRTHPALAIITAAFVLLHLHIGVEWLLGDQAEDSRLSETLSRLGGVRLWGLFHLTVAGLLLVGAWRDYRLVRWGYLLGMTAFVCTGALVFWIALFEPGAGSFMSVTLSVGLAMVSYSGYREPPLNPATAYLEVPGGHQ